MSTETREFWRCDRCSESVTTDQGDRPGYWMGYRLTAFPVSRAAALDANPDRTGHLCQSCHYDLDAWMRRSGRYLPRPTRAVYALRLEVSAGAALESVCTVACLLAADLDVEVAFAFNGTGLKAAKDSTPAALMAEFATLRGGR